MKVPSSSWHPLRWVYDLSQVWRDTRQIVLVAQIAAIYAAILIPFKVGIPLIPGFAELRPVNTIPIVNSLLFGPASARPLSPNGAVTSKSPSSTISDLVVCK